jgi:hypothetical protein
VVGADRRRGDGGRWRASVARWIENNQIERIALERVERILDAGRASARRQLQLVQPQIRICISMACTFSSTQ